MRKRNGRCSGRRPELSKLTSARVFFAHPESDSSVVNAGEKAMKTYLVAKGNAFQMLPPTVPESVNRAFQAASDAMHGNGACNVEGKLWGDESGHHFEVQSMQNAQRDEMRRHQFEHELAKHNADCEVEKHRMQVQAEQAKYNVWFDGMKQLLKDGLITVKEFLEETRVK